MGICELCGKKTDKLFLVIVEGAVLRVCEECKRYGTEVKSINPKTYSVKQKTNKIFIEEYEEEIIENYNKLIRFARESKGYTQEKMAKILGIKESLYKSIEEGKVRPPIELAKKIEKELGIKIIRKVALFESSPMEEPKLTIADVIEFEED